VSHETIYMTIYAHARGELLRQLIPCLRQDHIKPPPHTRGTDRRGQIPEMVSIHVRLPGVEDRLMPGHWKADLIKDPASKSSVAVPVKRSSRLDVLWLFRANHSWRTARLWVG
jgi:transposase, IS30 family